MTDSINRQIAKQLECRMADVPGCERSHDVWKDVEERFGNFETKSPAELFCEEHEWEWERIVVVSYRSGDKSPIILYAISKLEMREGFLCKTILSEGKNLAEAILAALKGEADANRTTD